MNTRICWLLSLVLTAGVVAGCPSTDSSPPTVEFVAAWGETGGDPGQFRDPIGIEVVGDAVVVSEAGNRRVQVLERVGTPRRQIGPALPGGDTLRRPMHVAASGSTLYVPDYNTDRVHVLSLDGNHERSTAGTGLDEAGIPAAFDAPGGVAVDATERLYVADFYNHRIQVFSAEGAFLTAFGEQGDGEGQFERPVDVAVTDDGTLYVVDFGNDRIQTFRRSP